MDSLLEKAIKAQRELTTAEQDEYATLKSQTRSLERIIVAREGSTAALADARKIDRVHVPTPGQDFGRSIRFLATTKGNRAGAAQLASNAGYVNVAKALSIGDGVSGGYLVGETLQRDFIGLLRPQNAFLSASPVIVDMTNAPKVDTSRVTSGCSVAYLSAPDQDTAASAHPTFGRVSLEQKKLGASMPVSNDLLRYSEIAETIISGDLAAALSQVFDQAMLRGDGTAGQPKGLRYLAPAAQVHTMTATPTAATVTTDLLKLEADLDDANIPQVRRALFLAPRVIRWLRTLLTSGGAIAFPELREEEPYLLSFQVFPTKQIPTNLGGGTESELIACEMSQCMFGNGPLKLKMDQFAGYRDANNVLHAAMSQDQTVLHVLWAHDVAVRHPEAVSVLTGVTWGA
nr:hypothetical protein Hi04_10k_c2220_00022 [uncultured bacterium]